MDREGKEVGLSEMAAIPVTGMAPHRPGKNIRVQRIFLGGAVLIIGGVIGGVVKTKKVKGKLFFLGVIICFGLCHAGPFGFEIFENEK